MAIRSKFQLIVASFMALSLLPAAVAQQHTSKPVLKREVPQADSATGQTQPPAGQTQIPAGQSQAPPAQSKPKTLFLTGEVEHSDRLDPVAPQLCAGATFTAQSLPVLQPNNDWYWIPSWYAGRKHADTDTILEDFDFKTGNTTRPNRVITTRQDLDIGFQPDRNGQIWEFKRAPYNATIEGDTFIALMAVRNRDPLQVSANTVVIRLVQTSITVDKSSQKIMHTEQQEQINTYSPAAPGVMNLQTSIKSFGQDGSPLMQETSTRVVVDRGPFQPIDSYQGRDMRSLFREFMLTHGYNYLLPDYLNAASSQPGVPPYSVNTPSGP